MAMMEGDLVLPTKPAGLGWWRITSSRVGPAAASPKLQRVRLKPASLFDKATPTEPSVWIAPRSLARHYFDVSGPYLAPHAILTISVGNRRHNVRC